MPGISELDIWLNSGKYLYKGFGPAAIQMLKKHLFNNGYHTIIMRPSKRNTKAISAYQKAGLRIIEPDYITYYKTKYIEQYGSGDWGNEMDEFMICKKIK